MQNLSTKEKNLSYIVCDISKFSRMYSLVSFINIQYIIVVLFLSFSASNARFLRFDNKVAVSKTITVDAGGSGDFVSVQEAINSVPSESEVWTHIRIKTGTYTEKIRITRDKPFIALSGEDMWKTVIQWDDFANGAESASVIISGDNFLAANITFKNTYNLGNSEHRVQVAPAATVHADKASFYNVAFYGVQDTLTDMQGRHYFKNCYIEGATDFIWGHGQSIYEDCKIRANKGYITAQGRESEDDPSGFVFLRGTVEGEGPAILGRAYRSHARVVFKDTFINVDLKPEGWNIWNQAGHEDTITYAEVNCTGPNYSKAGRPKWANKELSAEELHSFTDVDTFLNQDKWIQQQAELI